jgi:predicted deacylase
MLEAPRYVQVGGIYAAPGEKISGYLRALTAAESVELPVVVAHGVQPGPSLALIAGVHGSEYPGILAVSETMRNLDPATLSGVVLGVIVANVPAFRGRREKICPLDGKNLATVFPGDPNGSPSQVIADVIQREIVAQADYVIELHGGDAFDELTPFSIYTRTGNEETDRRALGFAQSYGLPIIETPSWDGRFRHVGGLYSTACALGKPGFVAEAGQNAIVEPEAVVVHCTGIDAAMRHLGMLPGGGNAGNGSTPPATARYVSMRSAYTGLLRSHVEAGQTVGEGDVIAEVTDYFGNVLSEIRAPIGGTVVYFCTSLSIQTGEALGGIADFSAAI